MYCAKPADPQVSWFGRQTCVYYMAGPDAHGYAYGSADFCIITLDAYIWHVQISTGRHTAMQPFAKLLWMLLFCHTSLGWLSL